MKRAKAERLYNWWLTHPTKGGKRWSYAAIGRMYHCSREYVRQVIAEKGKPPADRLARAQELAEENQNTEDSLVER